MECNVVDNACTFLLSDRLNLLFAFCLHYFNGVGVVLKFVVFAELWRNLDGLSQVSEAPFYFSFAAEQNLPKPFTKPSNAKISSDRRKAIILEPLFLLIKVPALLKAFLSIAQILECSAVCYYNQVILIQRALGLLLPWYTYFLEVTCPFNKRWASFENHTSFKNFSSASFFFPENHMATLFSISARISCCLFWIQYR